MPSSRSATHRAGHGSNRSAASTAKTGTSSVLAPRSWRAPDFDDLAGRRDQRRSGAQFVDGPERVGCAVREHRRHLDERQMLGCFSAATETLSCSAIVERADDMGTFVAVPNAALRHLPNRITFRLVASAHTMEGPEFSQDREGSGR